jgi:aryl-alcohol dehydrogenase-like predicted oxidoreductase
MEMGLTTHRGELGPASAAERGERPTIRHAHAQPIAAVQSEYSFWTRDLEHNGVLAAFEELDIGFVHSVRWVPAFLAGKIDPSATFSGVDFRSLSPRFAPDARAANMAMVELLKRITERKHAGADRARRAIRRC